MGLRNFFRKKNKETAFDYKSVKNGCEVINEGILFEVDDIFLKWGTGIQQLAKQYEVKKEFRADRIIYRWGERFVLNGLKLDLVTVTWNSIKEQDDNGFYSIEFLSIGHSTAAEHADLIRMHMEKEFGAAFTGETNGTEAVFEWRVKGVKIGLSFFERHSNKLDLRIEKIGI